MIASSSLLPGSAKYDRAILGPYKHPAFIILTGKHGTLRCIPSSYNGVLWQIQADGGVPRRELARI